MAKCFVCLPNIFFMVLHYILCFLVASLYVYMIVSCLSWFSCQYLPLTFYFRLSLMYGLPLFFFFQLIIRSHEGPDAREKRDGFEGMAEGYTIDHVVDSGKLITLFSAPDYPQFQVCLQYPWLLISLKLGTSYFTFFLLFCPPCPPWAGGWGLKKKKTIQLQSVYE